MALKIFSNLRTKRIFVHILVMLLGMALLMFLMAFVFIGEYIADNYEAQGKESARQLLSTAGEYVELAVSDLGRAMGQLLWNTDVTRAVLIPDLVSYKQKVEITKALATFEQDHPLVERAYLLTFPNQMCYSAAGEIIPLKDAPQHRYLPGFNGNVSVRTAASGNDTLVLTLEGEAALLQSFPTPEENGALLAELREDVLLHFLDDTLGGTGAYLEVQDPSGALIRAVGEPAAAEEHTESYISPMGWRFQLRQSRGQTQLSAGELIQIIGLWMLLFGAVSAGAAVLITWDIYRPIGALRSAVQENASGGEDELELVRRVYEDAVRQKTSLTQKVEEMIPIVQERLYKNLLRGRIPSERYLLERLSYLNSPLPSSGIYLVFTASLGGAEGAEESMSGLYQWCVQQKSGGIRAAEYLLMDDYSLTAILAFDLLSTTAQIKQVQREQAQGLKRCGQQNDFGGELFIGWGKPCRRLLDLHYSYRESLEELNFRQYHGPDAEPFQDSAGEDCRQLLELARNGETAQARRAFELLLQRLRQETEEDAALRAAYGKLMDDMVDALLSQRVPEEKLAVFESYYCRSEELDGEALEQLAAQAGNSGLTLLGAYGQKNRNRYVAQAQKYIEEHCTDSHLSLETAAESIGINSAYLSRLFYELSEVNFVNYVNGCRVERAKLLLRQSKLPVQEVGFRSGFNSVQNFNRVFKRHTGTTPGAYRKDPREAEGK